jgi:isopenicillin-N epimerase
MNRRLFVRSAAAGALGFPLLKNLGRLWTPDTMDEIRQGQSLDEESFWLMVRQHFMICDGIYMNNGTVGSVPRPVFDAMVEHMRGVEEVFHDQGFDGKWLKSKVAGFIGASEREVAVTRNTTEGMNFAAHGLDLKKGDEVVTTDQEHVGGLCCWQLRAKRHGIVIKTVPIPMPAEDPAEILNRFDRAITRRTRVLSFSHINFTTGLVMPARELCTLARDRGIVSVVDGAHGPGMLLTDVHGQGCDFYASSSHKWLCAPKGTGILYVRDGILDTTWTTVASGGWDDMSLGAARFDTVGTLNLSLKFGLGRAIEFQEAIGKERIERRVHTLNQYAKEKVSAVPGVRMFSSMKPELSGGTFAFKMDGIENSKIAEILMKTKKIRVRQVNEYDYKFIRISTHIYNSFQEIDTLAEILSGIASGKNQG